MFSLAIRNAGRTARPSIAAFSTTARARSEGSNMHSNDPDVIEKEKRRNLDKKEGGADHSPHDHAPGWNELLASVSEANVKADKDQGSPEELQQSTVSFIKARHDEEGDKEKK